MNRSPRFLYLVISATAVTLCVALPATRAGMYEGFEGPETSWRFSGTDCQSWRMLLHERRFSDAHTGRGCELVQFSAGPGTTLYLAHQIPAAPIIRELAPSLWVKADRAGIQLLARVVFPRTKGKDGQPLTSLLPGDSYTTPGPWRQLRIENLPQKLHREVWNLRTQSRTSIDEHEAYIDRLVLNVYTEAGGTSVWIDDLELAGLATGGEGSSPVSGKASVSQSATPVSVSVDSLRQNIQLQGTQLIVDGRPMFVRAIQHQGETMAYLRSLGFDAVLIPSPATDAQLAEAAHANLWVITPPPYTSDAIVVRPAHRQVLAWYSDEMRVGNDSTKMDDLERAVKLSDPQRRPIVFHTSDRVGLASDLAIRLADRQVLGTSFELLEYGPWLAEMSRIGRNDRPIWAALPTEPSPELESQISRLARAEPPSIRVEYDQLRLLAFEAVARGARGLCFRSQSRLDGPDDVSRYRAALLHAINMELELVAPWAAGGTSLGERITTHPEIRVVGLQTATSRLLVVSRTVSDQQYVAAPAPDEAVTFAVHGTPLTDQAYKVSPRGIESLPSQRGGGVRVVIDSGVPVSLVLMTQDPLAVNYVGRATAEIQARYAARQIEIADSLISETTRVAGAMAGGGGTLVPRDPRLIQAQAELRQATNLIERGDSRTAIQLTSHAMNAARRIRRECWESSVLSFTSPIASPLCAHFTSLPLHQTLGTRLAKSTWSTNVLAAGDLENMGHLLASGWLQEQTDQPGVETDVRLSLEGPFAGRAALQLRSWRDGTSNSLVIARPPIRISSAPVNVVEGQLIRVHGWVKVPSRFEGSSDGLLIYDSHSGPPLAERITETRGWQEFTLYRVATENGQIKVMFDHSGLGESWVDEVSITVLERLGP